MPKRIWRKAESGFLSDAAGLLALGGVALGRGFSYLPMNVNVDRSPAHALEGLLAPPVWAVVWIAIAVLCFAAIKFPRIMSQAVGLAVGLNAAWLVSFIGIQIIGGSDRAYVSALNYFGVVFFATWGFGRGRKYIPLTNAR